MTKRRVLNIASTKKRDNMISWDRTGTNNGFGAPSLEIGTTRFLFCATAREQVGLDLPSQRNSSTVFIKGYRENMTFITNNNNSWRWRRIMFRIKGFVANDSFLVTSAGYVRVWYPLTGTNMDVFEELIFEGTKNVDYQDPFAAKVDSTRVTVVSDKYRILASGNSASYIKHYPSYTPIEKNLVYDDDEDGDDLVSAPYSVNSKAGMGDLFIYDIFQDIGGVSPTSVNIRSSSTLYWHEK